MKEKRTRKTKTKKKEGDRIYSERVRAKWFCFAFNLGFLQSICIVSLIFKSNLELALSIIIKKEQLYESNHATVELRCLKIRDLISLFICPFANIARTTASTSKFI